jgi:hypothetical protein
MANMSERDIEIRELLEHPAFRIAVLQVAEELVRAVMVNAAERYAELFVFRSDLKDKCFKKGKNNAVV